jgi:DNA invertase Pin-like site-specific DNA recombinase
MQNSQDKLLHVAVYIRVSSDEQAERGDSIRDQKERGIKYINDHKNMIIQDVYLDDGVSGQKIDRDDFTRLINNVKDGLVDLIIFTKLDRWFRSLRHYLNTQAILEKYNAAWTAIDQPYFDTSTPYGRAFVAQSMTWAELEAQNGGLRVADVFRSKVAHGEVITGKVPRGYKIQDKKMVLSEEAPAIHDCIMHFLHHHSLNQTVLYMKDKYGIVMTIQNFRQALLKNEKLIGRYRGNTNYCPRLISDEDFQEIQRILNYNSNIKSNQRYPYIFSGLLVCNECGYKMGGGQINVLSKRNNGDSTRYKYPAYECKKYRAYKECDNGGEIREIRIEEYLLKHVRDHFNSYVSDFETNSKSIIDNRAKKNQIRKKIERLKDLYLNEAITIEEFKTDRIKFEEQLAELPDVVQPNQDIKALKNILDTDFESMYLRLDNEQKRIFWRSIIKEIRVSKSINRNREYTIEFI